MSIRKRRARSFFLLPSCDAAGPQSYNVAQYHGAFPPEDFGNARATRRGSDANSGGDATYKQDFRCYAAQRRKFHWISRRMSRSTTHRCGRAMERPSGVCTDITERKKYLEEIEALKTRVSNTRFPRERTIVSRTTLTDGRGPWSRFQMTEGETLSCPPTRRWPVSARHSRTMAAIPRSAGSQHPHRCRGRTASPAHNGWSVSSCLPAPEHTARPAASDTKWEDFPILRPRRPPRLALPHSSELLSKDARPTHSRTEIRLTLTVADGTARLEITGRRPRAFLPDSLRFGRQPLPKTGHAFWIRHQRSSRTARHDLPTPTAPEGGADTSSSSSPSPA